MSDWKLADGQFTLRATIPANTTATVYIPTSSVSSVKESGQSAVNAKGVKFLRQEKATAVYTVGSGTYEFTAAVPSQP